MNFFEHQHLARRNTRVMLILFVLAVAAVVTAVDLLLGLVWTWGVDGMHVPPSALYVWGALGTLMVILGASGVEAFRLRDGGEVIARMAGGRRVAPDTREPLERRLVNVIEEMAIASGVRVPQVYVMDDEAGINAFAAGYDVSNAVVAVTRGTLERLNRDELQGVVGHEFSHILNGDMWLNIRMMGVLAGIVFIGSIGRFLMRGSRETRDSKGLALVGLALFVIGYVGLFFARLIKSAVSRQREFLADASSVQFTRNPDGIAGALDQIRASSLGALISGRYAEELSHMFFGQGVKLWLGSIFDTHPPLEERIYRVRPGFQSGRYRAQRSAAAAADIAARAVTAKGRRVGDLGVAWGRSPAESAALVGSMQGGKIEHAARLLATLPAPLREALRDAGGAAAALVALLLAPTEEVQQQQLEALHALELHALAERAQGMLTSTRGLGPEFRLPVVDLALPALRLAAPEAKKDLLAALQAVIYADRRVSLHEFVVLTLVRNQLAPSLKAPAGAKRLAQLKAEAMALLALVAHAGTRADATGERQKALDAGLAAGAREIGFGGEPAPANALSLNAVSAALTALTELAPLEKALLIKGLFATVTADGTIRVGEAELMRLAGAVLDCPLPPLLEDYVPYETR